MQIEPIQIEAWLSEWRASCDWDLVGSYVDCLTLSEILKLAERDPAELSELLAMKLTYGTLQGSVELRKAIAARYMQQTRENVVVTHGTVGANMLVHRALVDHGDRVVSIVPSYQQHHSLPESIGADVQLLHLKEENRWLPDLAELRQLAVSGTKLIVMTNPNNPTGALLDRELLEEIVSIARESGAWLLCDEVYRGVDQEGPGTTVAVADLYERGISTGGLSKSYSLPGLRIGWIVASRLVVDDVMVHREYDTIAVSIIDDYLGTLAIEQSEQILARSRAITRENLAIVSDWVEQERLLSWVRPQSGTVCLIKYDLQMSSRDFCVGLLKRTGVLLAPGSVFGMEGYVRIGFAADQKILKESLKRISSYLETN